MTDAPIPPHVDRERVVEAGEVDGILWVTCRSWRDWPAMLGYVRLPPGHPWRGLGYDEIHDLDPSLDVHGGLTFAEGDWVGFDTAHAGDRWPVPDEAPEVVHLMFGGRGWPGDWEIDWTPAKVAGEAQRLAAQVARVGMTPGQA